VSTWPCGRAEVRIYDRTKTTLLATFDDVAAVEWSAHLDGSGGLSFVVSRWLPELVATPDLLDDCTATVAVPLAAGGALTELELYAVRHDHQRRIVVEGNDRALETIEVRGARTATEAWLTDAVVRPEYAATAATMPTLAGPERAVSWVSSEYDPADDPSLWNTPVTFTRPDPTGWPTGTGAAWLNPGGSGPAERFLARGWLTIAALGVHRFHFSGDESTTVWVAGEILIRTSEQEYGRKRTNVAERTMYPGTYAVAIDMLLVDSGSAGDGQDGFKLAVCTLDNDGDPDDWLLVTNTASWVATAVAEGADMPGPATGAVLHTLVAEAQSRNVPTLDAVTMSFDWDEDSTSTAWPALREERLLENGVSTVWQAARGLGDMGLDVRISPAKALDAWHERGSDLSATVWVQHWIELTARGVPPLGSVADVRVPDGWVTVTDSAAVAAFGRREFGMQMGSAQSIGQGRRLATRALADDVARQQEIMSGRFHARDGAVPYADWNVGDVVTVGPDGSDVPQRCLALAGSWDGAGPVVWQAAWGQP
jgi:hypothetical protein